METRVRRFAIDVLDDGNTSSAVEVNDPNCLGWELSWNVEAAAKAIVGATIKCKDIWEDGPASLEYGEFQVGVGGKLYIPYPAFSISGIDMAANDDGVTSVIRIVARTVECSGHTIASSELIAFDNDEVGASSATEFTVPKQAIAYKVTGKKAGGPLSVTLSFTPPSGSEEVLSQWIIKNDEVNPLSTGGQLWRDLPQTPVGKVTIANADAGNAAEVCVWWRFDLRRVK